MINYFNFIGVSAFIIYLIKNIIHFNFIYILLLLYLIKEVKMKRQIEILNIMKKTKCNWEEAEKKEKESKHLKEFFN